MVSYCIILDSEIRALPAQEELILTMNRVRWSVRPEDGDREGPCEDAQNRDMPNELTRNG